MHIGNNRTTEMAGDLTRLSPEERLFAGCAAERALWFARDGDVLVLPQTPPDDYVRYVTVFTGTDPASLRVVVPAPGYVGPHLLTEDRLTAAATREAVLDALAGQSVDRVLSFYPDASVAALARSLGATSALPGAGFFAQGGSGPANSKAVFRAIAAGVGIPIAPGAVPATRQEAAEAIGDLLVQGLPVMVKREFNNGSFGNEILSLTPGLEPFGAQQVVVLQDREAVEDYLKRRWNWLTDEGVHRVVVERYFTDARPVYAEFLVDDHGVEYTGQGELLMAPLFDGVVIPVPRLDPDTAASMVDRSRRLCEAFHAIGYRGTMSVDGIVTDECGIVLNETNSRFSGSTHLHDGVVPRVIGSAYARRRVLYERGGWTVPSFLEATRLLAAAALAYDHATHTGIILTCDFARADGSVRYCVVAEDIDGAREMEQRLLRIKA